MIVIYLGVLWIVYHYTCAPSETICFSRKLFFRCVPLVSCSFFFFFKGFMHFDLLKTCRWIRSLFVFWEDYWMQLGLGGTVLGLYANQNRQSNPKWHWYIQEGNVSTQNSLLSGRNMQVRCIELVIETTSLGQVMRSIEDNITEEVVLDEIQEIISLPMYADRINSDSRAHGRRKWILH